MNSLVSGFIERQPIPQNLLRTIRLLGEFKGKEELFNMQLPQALETLRQAAIIQSTESSNRIEGVIAPHERIVQLVAKKTKPRDRSEQEIAGYRDILNTIHANHAHMSFGAGLVLQLHRDLFKFTTERGGQWKSSTNEIAELRPDGTKFVRFTPVAPHLTEEAMRSLHDRFRELWEGQQVEPLLLIPAYVLDFLCIHPFRDGNGRMARLLSLLLLYQAGYQVGRFISLELVVEETKQGYYALYQSSQKWHGAKHALLPWWEYFLGVMLLAAYRKFENRIGIMTVSRGAKTGMILNAIRDFRGEFTVRDLQRCCPTVGIDHLRKILQAERTAKRIVRLGFGRDARWRKLP